MCNSYFFVRIADSGISSLEGKVFQGLGKLKRLSLNGNNLVHLKNN